MKFTTAALSVILALTVSAAPAPAAIEERGPAIQVVHMVMHGGPASYDLDVPADGQYYATNNDLNINIIDTPSYNAYANCQFSTDGQVALVSAFNNGVQGIVVGPPQAIRGVRCQGSCVSNYSDCYVNGQSVGSCCNGYCSGNKCRPYF